MVLTILVSEYLVGKALGELLAARSNVSSVKKSGRMPKHGWNMIQAYMANMDHFVLDFSEVKGQEMERARTNRVWSVGWL
jgi:hypothetical protein